MNENQELWVFKHPASIEAAYVNDEEAAENYRRDLAKKLQCVVIKRRADENETLDDRTLDDCWNHKNFKHMQTPAGGKYHCECKRCSQYAA